MPKKILLADDSVTIQKVVSITLAHEDFDLTIVDNGSKAVSKAKELKPDVILLDVVMPDKDGYQVCQEIKENAELKSIPVILLTGTFEPFDADRAAEVGADDFIKKPFESHTLINKVKEMASRSGVSRGKPVDISGVDIDFETPVEGGYDETPKAKGAALEETVPIDDLETPWEGEAGAADRSGKQESEDIWSVEEFEDISEPEADVKPREREPRPPAGAGGQAPPPAAPAREPVREAAPREAAASDEFFVREGKPRDVEAESFELGEEISEDELERFLDEETDDTEISVGDETGAEELAPSADKEDIFMGDEGEPPARRERKEESPFEEDLFVEEFEESSAGTGARGRTDEFLGDESLDDGPIELEWEDEPLPETRKAPAAVKADDLETLIRRTTEEELADFARERKTAPVAEGRPATREFEVDLSSFDEQPGRGASGTGGPRSETFDFEELSDEKPFEGGSPDEGPAVGVSPGQKDMSKAVDKIAREVIEKVVWEVVPELAEELIKQEIKRLKGEKS